MKKTLAMLLALLMLVSLCGCARLYYAVQGMLEYGQQFIDGPDEPVIEPPVVEPADPEPFEWPAPSYEFGAGPLLEYGAEQRGLEYSGSMFNEIYNTTNEPLSAAEIDALELSLRVKKAEGGELFDFLAEYCDGYESYVEARAVTVDGVDEPYRCLYVRLYYDDVIFEDGSYTGIYERDLALIRVNCDEQLGENGFDVLIFSMYNSEELKVMSIISREDGSFVFDD